MLILKDSIDSLSQLLEELLEKAQQHVMESVENFVSDKIRCLGKAIGGYYTCMSKIKASTRAEFEEMWKSNYHDRHVRESIENLLEVEENWDQFLKDVDQKIGGNQSASSVNVGTQAPMDLPIFNITTSRY